MAAFLNSDAARQQVALARRAFLAGGGISLGAAALATLESRRSMAAAIDPTAAQASSGGRVHPPLPGLPHHASKAKQVIYLHMNGGPSQIDLWDYKPVLNDYFDKDLPPSIRGDQRLSTMTSGQDRFPCAPSKFRFEQ